MMTTVEKIRQQVPKTSNVFPRGRKDNGHGFGHHGINHGDHDHDHDHENEFRPRSKSDTELVRIRKSSIIPNDVTIQIVSSEQFKLKIENAKNSLSELIIYLEKKTLTTEEKSTLEVAKVSKRALIRILNWDHGNLNGAIIGLHYLSQSNDSAIKKLVNRVTCNQEKDQLIKWLFSIDACYHTLVQMNCLI